MNLIRQLRNLQEVDLNLEKATLMLQQIKSQLNSNPILVELEELERNLTQKQGELGELEKEQRTLEWKVEDLSSKVLSIEEKLYSNTVKNPKELQHLQQEVEGFRSSVQPEEDKILNLMVQVEAVQREITEGEIRRKELQEDWKHKSQLLLAESSRIERVLSEDGQKRGALAAEIDPAYLKLYETLRADKQGRAIVQIKQGRCGGCLITLPLNIMRRARLENQLLQCSNCGRILYLL